ncbi:MAG: TraR/DksA C4-type zinc finger protein [Actinobacteria bacterium]|nr:TraR/DksA C4-type zinc finger protein [Actinomycetota bacterium]
MQTWGISMEQDKLTKIRSELQTELATVEHQLTEHGATPNHEDAVEVSTDEGFADSAQATMERSEILSLIEQLQHSHAAIGHALKRMDEGTYGKCERCGQPIPVERLEARPTSSLCVKCAQLVSS